MKHTIWMAFLGVMVCSCAHAPPSSGVICAAPPQLLSPDARGASVAIPAGEPLHAEQVFALELELRRPAHVYVVHRRGGVLGSLYPGVGQADVEQSSGVIRLPGRDSWMRVPPLEARNRLCVLLSAQPLDASLRRCFDGRPPRSLPHGVQSYTLAMTR